LADESTGRKIGAPKVQPGKLAVIGYGVIFFSISWNRAKTQMTFLTIFSRTGEAFSNGRMALPRHTESQHALEQPSAAGGRAPKAVTSNEPMPTNWLLAFSQRTWRLGLWDREPQRLAERRASGEDMMVRVDQLDQYLVRAGPHPGPSRLY
jgi:hypothetical protein